MERRRTERAATEAKAEHQAVADTYETIRERHAPVIERHQQLANQLERYREDRGVTWGDRYKADPTVIEQKLEALETWHDWATGKPTTQPDLTNTVTVLRHLAVDRGQDWETREQYKELAGTLTDWARELAHRIRLPEPPTVHIRTPEIDFGIDL